MATALDTATEPVAEQNRDDLTVYRPTTFPPAPLPRSGKELADAVDEALTAHFAKAGL